MKERKRSILQLVNDKRKVLVPELATNFGVSTATIRKDLRNLDQEGLLKKTHGGAVSIDLPRTDFVTANRRMNMTNTDWLHEITKAAAEFIESGDIIILDSGIAVQKLTKMFEHKQNITIVVNDLVLAHQLEPIANVQVVVIGGILRKKFHCTVGSLATEMLSNLNVDKAFITADGICLERGCTTTDVNLAEIKRWMANISSQVIIMCESNKLKQTSLAKFIEVSEIDKLVTHSNANDGNIQEFEKLGIEVILV